MKREWGMRCWGCRAMHVVTPLHAQHSHDMSEPTYQLAVHRHQHGAGQADGVLGDEMQSNICWDGSSWGGLVSKLAAHHLRIPSLLWIIDQTSLESVYRNHSDELLQDSHTRTKGLLQHIPAWTHTETTKEEDSPPHSHAQMRTTQSA